MMCTVTDEGQTDYQHSCKAFAFAGKNLLLFSNSRTVKEKSNLFSFADVQARTNFPWINFGVSVFS